MAVHCPVFQHGNKIRVCLRHIHPCVKSHLPIIPSLVIHQSLDGNVILILLVAPHIEIVRVVRTQIQGISRLIDTPVVSHVIPRKTECQCLFRIRQQGFIFLPLVDRHAVRIRVFIRIPLVSRQLPIFKNVKGHLRRSVPIVKCLYGRLPGIIHFPHLVQISLIHPGRIQLHPCRCIQHLAFG